MRIVEITFLDNKNAEIGKTTEYYMPAMKIDVPLETEYIELRLFEELES
jgi:hypothetical protein